MPYEVEDYDQTLDFLRQQRRPYERSDDPVLDSTRMYLTEQGYEEPEPGYWEVAGKGFVRGLQGIYAGLGRGVELFADVAQEKDPFLSSMIDMEQLRRDGKGFADWWDNAQQEGWAKPDPRLWQGEFWDKPSFKRAGGVFMQGAASWLAAWLAGGITGGVVRGLGLVKQFPKTLSAMASAGLLSVSENAPTYVEAKEKGVSTGQAGEFAAMGIAATYALEFLPFMWFLNRLGGGGILRSGMSGFIAEWSTEQAQQVAQNMIAKYGYDETVTLSRGWMETLIGGGGPGMVTGFGIGLMNDFKRRAIERGIPEAEVQADMEAVGEELAEESQRVTRDGTPPHETVGESPVDVPEAPQDMEMPPAPEPTPDELEAIDADDENARVIDEIGSSRPDVVPPPPGEAPEGPATVAPPVVDELEALEPVEPIIPSEPPGGPAPAAPPITPEGTVAEEMLEEFDQAVAAEEEEEYLKKKVKRFHSGLGNITDMQGGIESGEPIGAVMLTKKGTQGLSKNAEQEMMKGVEAGREVMLDTGAYSNFTERQKNPEHPPLTTEQMDKAVTRFEEIVENTPEDKRGNLSLVVPDEVGNQEQTLDWWYQFRERIAALHGKGVQLLVPIQVFNPEGRPVDLDPRGVYRTARRLFGDDIIPSVPSAAEAFTNEQLAVLIEGGIESNRIHFLGLGEKNAQYRQKMQIVREMDPDLDVTIDARFAEHEVTARRTEKVEKAAEEEISDYTAETDMYHEWRTFGEDEAVGDQLEELGATWRDEAAKTKDEVLAEDLYHNASNIYRYLDLWLQGKRPDTNEEMDKLYRTYKEEIDKITEGVTTGETFDETEMFHDQYDEDAKQRIYRHFDLDAGDIEYVEGQLAKGVRMYEAVDKVRVAEARPKITKEGLIEPQKPDEAIVSEEGKKEARREAVSETISQIQQGLEDRIEDLQIEASEETDDMAKNETLLNLRDAQEFLKRWREGQRPETTEFMQDIVDAHPEIGDILEDAGYRPVEVEGGEAEPTQKEKITEYSIQEILDLMPHPGEKGAPFDRTAAHEEMSRRGASALEELGWPTEMDAEYRTKGTGKLATLEEVLTRDHGPKAGKFSWERLWDLLGSWEPNVGPNVQFVAKIEKSLAALKKYQEDYPRRKKIVFDFGKEDRLDPDHYIERITGERWGGYKTKYDIVDLISQYEAALAEEKAVEPTVEEAKEPETVEDMLDEFDRQVEEQPVSFAVTDVTTAQAQKATRAFVNERLQGWIDKLKVDVADVSKVTASKFKDFAVNEDLRQELGEPEWVTINIEGAEINLINDPLSLLRFRAQLPSLTEYIGPPKTPQVKREGVKFWERELKYFDQYEEWREESAAREAEGKAAKVLPQELWFLDAFTAEQRAEQRKLVQRNLEALKEAKVGPKAKPKKKGAPKTLDEKVAEGASKIKDILKKPKIKAAVAKRGVPWDRSPTQQDIDYADVDAFQDKYGENAIRADWDLANSPRVVLMGAGDILRNHSQGFANTGYVAEKLGVIDKYLTDIEDYRIHPHDSIQQARDHASEKLERYIEFYEKQPTETRPQELARQLALALAKGEDSRARELYDKMAEEDFEGFDPTRAPISAQLKASIAEVDEESYKQIAPILTDMWDAAQIEGLTTKEFIAKVVKEIGAEGKPYFARWANEQFKVKGEPEPPKEGEPQGVPGVTEEGLAPEADRPESRDTGAVRREGEERTYDGRDRPPLQISGKELVPTPPNRIPSGRFVILDQPQRQAVNLILDAFARGWKGFLLADGTGTGKTMIQLVAAQLWAEATGKPTLIVTQNKQIIDTAYLKDAYKLGMDPDTWNIEIGTYTGARQKKIGMGAYGVAVFDEAQNLKNISSKQTIASEEINAEHRVFATATPMDNPTGAAYFISRITGKPESQVHRELGFEIREFRDPTDNNKVKPYPVLLEGMTWAKVFKKIIENRVISIENGTYIRREYPFWGTVRIQEIELDEATQQMHDDMMAYWQERIDAAHGLWKRRLSGQRSQSMARWTESLKADYIIQNIKKDLDEGKKVIVTVTTVNPITMKAYGDKEVMSALKQIEERLPELGVDNWAKIYGTYNKTAEVQLFQKGPARVALMTDKSGGAGVSLDDQVGDAPRKMYFVSPGWAGDVWQQVIGRPSRRNTKSPTEIVLLRMPTSFGDARQWSAVHRKVDVLRAIQEGVDPDEAGGFIINGPEGPVDITRNMLLEIDTEPLSEEWLDAIDESEPVRAALMEVQHKVPLRGVKEGEKAGAIREEKFGVAHVPQVKAFEISVPAHIAKKIVAGIQGKGKLYEPRITIKTIDEARGYNVTPQRVQDFIEFYAKNVTPDMKDFRHIRKEPIKKDEQGKLKDIEVITLTTGCGRPETLLERIYRGLMPRHTLLESCFTPIGGPALCFLNLHQGVNTGQVLKVELQSPTVVSPEQIDKYLKSKATQDRLNKSPIIREGAKGDSSHAIASGMALEWMKAKEKYGVTSPTVFISAGYAPVTNQQYKDLAKYAANLELHISVGGWFHPNEIMMRLGEFKAARDAGLNPILRIVTNKDNIAGVSMLYQDFLLEQMKALNIPQNRILETTFHDDRQRVTLKGKPNPDHRSEPLGIFDYGCCEQKSPVPKQCRYCEQLCGTNMKFSAEFDTAGSANTTMQTKEPATYRTVWEERAKKHFGTTKNLREAGWVLADGTMLDFSERHILPKDELNTEEVYDRYLDHSQIGDIMEEGERDPDLHMDISNVVQFLAMGAVRLGYPGDTAFIEIMTRPTEVQWKRIAQMVKSATFVYFDVANPHDNTEDGISLPGGKMAIGEIRRFVDQKLATPALKAAVVESSGRFFAKRSRDLAMKVLDLPAPEAQDAFARFVQGVPIWNVWLEYMQKKFVGIEENYVQNMYVDRYGIIDMFRVEHGGDVVFVGIGKKVPGQIAPATDVASHEIIGQGARGSILLTNESIKYQEGIGETDRWDVTEDDVRDLFRKQQAGTDDQGTYITTKTGRRLYVRFIQSIGLDRVNVGVDYGRTDVDPSQAVIRGGYVVGSGLAGQGEIVLSRNWGNRWTLSHESYHWMEEVGIIDSRDKAIMRGTVKRLVRQGKFKSVNIRDIGGEEDRANLLAELQTQAPHSSVLKKILDKVMEFVDRIANWVGFRTTRGIMRDINSGKIYEEAGSLPFGFETGLGVSPMLPGWAYKKRDLPTNIAKLAGVTDLNWGGRMINSLLSFSESWQQRSVDRIHAMQAQLGSYTVERQGPYVKSKQRFPNKAYMLNRLSSGIQTMIAMIFRHGPATFNADGVPIVDTEDEGFIPWLHSLHHDDVDKVFWYIAAKRSELYLDPEGRERWLTEGRRQEIYDWVGDRPKTEGYDDWDGLASVVNNWNKTFLDMGEQSGLFTAAQRATWEQEFYTPMWRIFEDADAFQELLAGPKQNRQKIEAHIRRLHGSERKFGDPFDNLIRSWANLAQQSVLNIGRKQAFIESMKLQAANPTYPSLLERVHPKLVKGIKDPQTGKVTWVHRPSGELVLNFMHRGEKIWFRTHDVELLNALMNVQPIKVGDMAMRLFSAPKHWMTVAATASVGFRIANSIKDSINASLLSPHFIPIWTSMKGFVSAMREDQDYINFASSMAAFGTSYVAAEDPQALARYLKRIGKGKLRTKGGLKNWLVDSPRKLWRLWEKIGTASENAARVGVYKNMRNAGYSHLEAAYFAKDLADFSMRGDAKALQYLTSSIPFMNARLISNYRLGRGIYENPKAVLTKGMMLASASMLLWSFNRDDDRYKELEPWEKMTYYHWWPDEDTHVRIPKPFEAGALFSSFFEASADSIDQADMDPLADWIKYTVQDNWALIDVPQALKPLSEQWMNKSWFTGRPIEGARLKARIPGERAEPWTSETLQLIGKKFNISPKRLESLIRGYTASLGMGVLWTTDIFARHYAFPERPTWTVEDLPGISRIARRAKYPRHTSFETEFFKMMTEIDEFASTVTHYQRTGRYDLAREMREKEQSKLYYKKPMAKARARARKLSNRIRRVWDDPNMSGDEKRKLVDIYSKQRQELLKGVYEIYERGQ